MRLQPNLTQSQPSKRHRGVPILTPQTPHKVTPGPFLRPAGTKALHSAADGASPQKARAASLRYAPSGAPPPDALRSPAVSRAWSFLALAGGFAGFVYVNHFLAQGVSLWLCCLFVLSLFVLFVVVACARFSSGSRRGRSRGMCLWLSLPRRLRLGLLPGCALVVLACLSLWFAFPVRVGPCLCRCSGVRPGCLPVGAGLGPCLVGCAG